MDIPVTHVGQSGHKASFNCSNKKNQVLLSPFCDNIWQQWHFALGGAHFNYIFRRTMRFKNWFELKRGLEISLYFPSNVEATCCVEVNFSYSI